MNSNVCKYCGQVEMDGVNIEWIVWDKTMKISCDNQRCIDEAKREVEECECGF